MVARRRDVWILGLAAITAAGAALRFATLSVQSNWLDEAVTHQLVTRSLGGMLRAIPHSESTPPLYYVAAWVWARVFGSGEAGLRSLSALAGTATIVIVAVIARRLAGNRAALAAAALAAASPLLIWYSQEARAYSLLVALCALSVLCVLCEAWRSWALAAALALATHYFAVFVVVPELAWIVWRRRARGAQGECPAVIAVLVVAAALVPLAIVQAGGDRAAFIHSLSLSSRIAAVPKQFLIGYATPHATVLTVLAVVFAAGLALGLRRRDGPMLGLAAFAVGVPVALAVVGADYLITRNVIAGIVPLAVLAAVASTRTRLGPMLVAGICAAGIVAFIGVEKNAAYQRDDWRAVARAIGPVPGTPIAVVLEPASGVPAFQIYAPVHRVRPSAATVLTVSEIDVVDLAHDAPTPTAPAPMAGFTVAAVVHTPEFTLVRYRAPAPTAAPFTLTVTLALVHAPGPAILAGG